MMHRSVLPLLFLGFAILLPCGAFAQEPDFRDLPNDHFAYEAVTFLRQNGIITGYPDGTFRPGQKVNRAEALKMIVGPLLQPAQIEEAKSARSQFADVSDDAWYKPYVEIARAAGIIDGPPEKETFNGGRPVIKVEFMKMVQEAFGADPVTAFNNIRLPLSSDVQNPDEWYYPYMRYGITSSMTMVGQNGTLEPGRELSRGETAVLLYRYIMYAQNRRTQALLSEAENEILIVLKFLEGNDILEAEYASARALLAARGAHLRQPDTPIVQGAVKVTEAFRALVRGYRAGLNNDLEETIRLAGEAWNLAAAGKERVPELSQICDQLQGIAKNMADSARAKKVEPPGTAP